MAAVQQVHSTLKRKRRHIKTHSEQGILKRNVSSLTIFFRLDAGNRWKEFLVIYELHQNKETTEQYL